MARFHAQHVGDKTLLSRIEFEQLLELARRSDQIELEVREDDVPTLGIMQLGDQGGAFNWLAEEPELYSVHDLKVRYR